MAAAFAVVSLLNWWHNGHSWRWTGGIAVVFLGSTQFCHIEVSLEKFTRIFFILAFTIGD
jgi:hypothetical protein